MKAVIRASSLSGTIGAPPSKSYTQRAVACALLADGTTEVLSPSESEDGLAALEAARMLGAKVTRSKGVWSVSGGTVATPEDVVNCKGSATALRLFTAISALAPGATVLTGSDSLRRRPMAELLSAMSSVGAPCFSTGGNGRPPIVVLGGGICGGTADIRGDVSSQFVSALLIACCKAKKETTIRLASPLESRGYVEMTLEVLRRFGADASAERGRGGFQVRGGQSLAPCRYAVEGDYSSASFMMAAGLLAGTVEVTSLAVPSKQGDSGIIGILAGMGGKIALSPKGSVLTTASELHGIRIDASQVPDLVPIIAVVASQAEGETVISGIGRLRLKESDRVETTVRMLSGMGARIRVSRTGDALIIAGKADLTGTVVDPSSDHRIAMACAVAALVARRETVIKGAECVSKSYPSFFADLKRLGADVELRPETRQEEVYAYGI